VPRSPLFPYYRAHRARLPSPVPTGEQRSIGKGSVSSGSLKVSAFQARTIPLFHEEVAVLVGTFAELSDDWTDAHASAPLRCAVSGAPLRRDGCVAYLYFRDPCYEPARGGSINLDHAAEACKKLAVAVAHAQREGTFLLVEPDLRNHVNVANLALAFQSVLYPSSISVEDRHTAGIARSNLSMVSLATTDGLTPWMHEGQRIAPARLCGEPGANAVTWKARQASQTHVPFSVQPAQRSEISQVYNARRHGVDRRPLFISAGGQGEPPEVLVTLYDVVEGALIARKRARMLSADGSGAEALAAEYERAVLSIPVEELADRLEPLFNDRGIGRDATAFEPRMKPFPEPTAWQATADKALEEDGAAEAELANSRATLASRVRTIPTKASLAGKQQQRFADLSSNERFAADKNESAASGAAKTLRYDGEYIHALLVRHGRAEALLQAGVPADVLRAKVSDDPHLAEIVEDAIRSAQAGSAPKRRRGHPSSGAASSGAGPAPQPAAPQPAASQSADGLSGRGRGKGKGKAKVG